MLKNLNVLIPMAGLGSRFAQAGYSKPKPLIDIFGKTMIERAIESLGIDGNYIFVIRKDENAKKLKSVLFRVKPDCRIIEITGSTEGSACTCLIAKDLINNKCPLVIANCDQIMEWDPKNFFHSIKKLKPAGSVVTYNSNTKKNSYVKINSQGHALQFAEKKVISNHSLNGVHYWAQGSDFVASAEAMIRSNDRTNNEFYIAPSYNYLVAMNKKIIIHEISPEKHLPVGTPEDLLRFKKRRVDQLGFDPSLLRGLKYIPDIGKEKNDYDKIKSEERNKFSVVHNFSGLNSKFLREMLNEYKPKKIVEIGVNNSLSYDHSSTFNFMEYLKKEDDCKYIGIDLQKSNIKQVTQENRELWSKNKISFINTDSANYDLILENIHKKLEGEVDFLLIDGWHSINQVLKEWRIVNNLSSKGVVVMHDTNNHPGPLNVLKAIDRSIFEVREPYKGRYDDWGIAAAILKK